MVTITLGWHPQFYIPGVSIGDLNKGLTAATKKYSALVPIRFTGSEYPHIYIKTSSREGVWADAPYKKRGVGEIRFSVAKAIVAAWKNIPNKVLHAERLFGHEMFHILMASYYQAAWPLKASEVAMLKQYYK